LQFNVSDGRHFIPSLVNKSVMEYSGEQLQEHDLISFSMFKVKTGSTSVLIIKEAPRIVMRAAAEQSLNLIGVPIQFVGTEADLNGDDSDAGDKPAAFSRASATSTVSVSNVPILVKTLNTDSGIDWQIRVTVNKKHPVKTHAKGQLFKVDLIDE